MAARLAILAITDSSSISVWARDTRFKAFLSEGLKLPK